MQWRSSPRDFSPGEADHAPFDGRVAAQGGLEIRAAAGRWHECAWLSGNLCAADLPADIGLRRIRLPESHAASFALLVYVSAWLKHYEPAAFCAALLNSQPMGFYAPAQLVQDARRHDVEVRNVDVTVSAWDCTLEEARCASACA
jgi:hypothetical protein